MMVEGKGLAGQGRKSDALPKKGGSISCWDFARKNILLCILEAVEGGLSSLEVLEVL